MITHVCAISLVLFSTTFENVQSISVVYPKPEAMALNLAQLRTVGTPLFVTKAIKSEKFAAARNLANVDRGLTGCKSHSGFLTVNETYDSNLFFWYFPAKINPATAPVLLYLEGGPGATVMFSLFLQNGPFMIGGSSIVSPRRDSWNNKHNVLYIDSPVGTGYSFTNNDAGYARGQTQIANELLNALVQFFKMFPILRANDFFVTGESYAGKFVPALCNAIHNWNPTTKTDKINLKGMAIANGYTDPKNQLIYGEFLYDIGLVDENGRDQFLAIEKRTRDLIMQGKHAEAYDVVSQLIDGAEPTLFKNLTDYDGIFNFLKDTDDIQVSNAYAWVQSPDVRRALHVGNRSFVPYSDIALRRLKNDLTRSQADLVEKLLEHYRVLIYTGNLDIGVGYRSVHNYLKNLNWSGAQEWKTAARKPWRVNGKLAGYVKKVKNLIDVTVRLAGHFVHKDRPTWGLDLLERFVRGDL